MPDGLPFRLVLVTHDESTFYQNNCRKTVWAQKTSRPTPQPKGDGQSIMVSDFLTFEWGRLRDGKESVHHHLSSFLFIYFVFREACVIFKTGKNRDGYFGIEELHVQVESAMDIFEGLSKGNFKALFLFDNASSHQKRAYDVILAWKMTKSVYHFTFSLFSFSSPSTQAREGAGHTTRVDRTCEMAHTLGLGDYIRGCRFLMTPAL